MDMITLNNGVQMPAIGFGTYKSTTDDGYQVVLDAIRVGYRHLDTAALYENEEDVGRAVRESGIPREEFFLTSKLNRNFLGYESAKNEFYTTLKKLDTDYLDLYLIHWPRADYGRDEFDQWKQLDIESWRALEELYKEGKIRAIGVSNFLPHHLENLLKNTDIVPAVNQLELHPGYSQAAACAYCREKGIQLEAWSPIGRGRLSENQLLASLAEKYGTSIPHLCLVFDRQEGIAVLPKSTHFERMKENLNLDDITISDEDMWMLRTMPQAGWSGEHPDCERIPV
jgi:diketogulonate reductase-like aldo/keto reductase